MTSNLFNLGINSFRIIDRPGKHLTLQKVAMPSGTKKDKKEVRKDEVRTVLTVLLDPLFLDLVNGACGMSNYFTLRLSHSRLKRKMPLGWSWLRLTRVTRVTCSSAHGKFVIDPPQVKAEEDIESYKPLDFLDPGVCEILREWHSNWLSIVN